MNSQRRKREEEIDRLLRGEGVSRKAELEFQEELRKASAAIVQEGAARVAEGERARRGAFGIGLSAGAWLLAAGLVVSVFVPLLGALLLAIGAGMLVWRVVRPRHDRFYRRAGGRR